MLTFLAVLLSGIALVSGFIFWDFTRPGLASAPVTVLFAPASHFRAMATQLAEAGVIRHPFLFTVLATFRGDAGRFKAGEYRFPAGAPAKNVEAMLASGRVVIHSFTVPEGWMNAEILAALQANPLLSGPITRTLKEGDLLPETYHYSRGDLRDDLLARMQRAMQKTLADAWAARAPNPYLRTPEDAVILASIVEKETGVPSERAHVAGLYLNRLKRGMLLQADPTTAYAVTSGAFKLTRPLSTTDLALRSAYNTYLFPGLPPGPIANPGRAALEAALHPAATDDLYFVATGTGGHHFARTKEEHEANVRRYREVVGRKK